MPTLPLTHSLRNLINYDVLIMASPLSITTSIISNVGNDKNNNTYKAEVDTLQQHNNNSVCDLVRNLKQQHHSLYQHSVEFEQNEYTKKFNEISTNSNDYSRFNNNEEYLPVNALLPQSLAAVSSSSSSSSTSSFIPSVVDADVSHHFHSISNSSKKQSALVTTKITSDAEKYTNTDTEIDIGIGIATTVATATTTTTITTTTTTSITFVDITSGVVSAPKAIPIEATPIVVTTSLTTFNGNSKTNSVNGNFNFNFNFNINRNNSTRIAHTNHNTSTIVNTSNNNTNSPSIETTNKMNDCNKSPSNVAVMASKVEQLPNTINNSSTNIVITTTVAATTIVTSTTTSTATSIKTATSIATATSTATATNLVMNGTNNLAGTSAFTKQQQNQHQQQQQQQQQQEQLQENLGHHIHTSREDIASLGGSSSITSQMSSTLSNNQQQNNNNNNNINTNNNNSSSSSSNNNSNHINMPMIGCTLNANCSINVNNVQNHLSGILKGASKENLLQSHYCNGIVNDNSKTVGGNDELQECEIVNNSEIHLTEQNNPGDGLGPLPSKWETAYTERGELYFIDHNTGTSHWLDPRLSKFQKKSLEECGEDELPYGWEKIEDSLYGTYYIDHINRKTQYENPVLEVKRRAAEQKQKHNLLQQMPPPPNVTRCHQRPQTPSSQSILNGAGASIALSSVSSASTLSTIDISQRAMQPPPPSQDCNNSTIHQQCEVVHQKNLLPYRFTRNPNDMQGERITTTLIKSARGLGITLVGGDDKVEEFLQIKSIVENGPAWLDSKLRTGDVLVYVNDTCVLGFTHHEMVNVFQSIMPGETVVLEVCRGYPLPFDPDDPNNEVVTTIAVDGLNTETEKQRRILMHDHLNLENNYNVSSHIVNVDNSSDNSSNSLITTTAKKRALNISGEHTLYSSGFILMKKPEVLTISLLKGAMGFGFTIADSALGQKVKKILDHTCCNELREGDILLEINDEVVKNKSHLEVVRILKQCSKTKPTLMKIERCLNNCNTDLTPNSSITIPKSGSNNGGNVAKLRKNFLGASTSGIGNNALFRSKTPTADLYSTMQKENLPIRPKTPLVDTRRARIRTPNDELIESNAHALSNDLNINTMNNDIDLIQERSLAESKLQLTDGRKSQSSLTEIEAINRNMPYMDPYPKMMSSLTECLADTSLGRSPLQQQSTDYLRTTASGISNYENHSDYMSTESGNYSSIYGLAQMPPTMSPLCGGLYGPPHTSNTSQQLGRNNSNTSTHSTSYHHNNHHESCLCYECQNFHNSRLRRGGVPLQKSHASIHPTASSVLNFYPNYQPSASTAQPAPSGTAVNLQAAHIQNERMQKRVNELLVDRRRVGFPFLEHATYPTNTTFENNPNAVQQQYLLNAQQHSPATPVAPPSLMRTNADIIDSSDEQYLLSEVTLQRQALGFGFRIVGGTEEGSQVTVGHIVPNGAADNDHRINTGDEILSIDGINVVNASHHKVVSLMGEAALRGQVTMILRRRTSHIPHVTSALQQQLTLQAVPLIHSQIARKQSSILYSYDVIVTRHESEGFGFVIISSSNQYYGSTIGKLIPGSPADRCGQLKVGDRIIAVNRIDIAGMPHGDVVNLIKVSGLHVRLTIGCPKEESIINTAPNDNNLLIDSSKSSSQQPSQQSSSVNADANFDVRDYFEETLLCRATNDTGSISPMSQIPQMSVNPLSIGQTPQL